MDFKGKTQIVIILKANTDDVAEGDRLFASHKAWMEKTHHRDGDKALLSYKTSKGADPSNALDPGSAPTGKTVYVIEEVYESPAGVADHWQQGMENWEDFQNFVAWAQKCDVTSQHSGTVINSLW